MPAKQFQTSGQVYKPTTILQEEGVPKSRVEHKESGFLKKQSVGSQRGTEVMLSFKKHRLSYN